MAFKGLVEIADVLVAAGSDVDARSADGRTALSMAAAFNRTPMVKWLLQHGASRDVCDASGARPIDMARALGAIDAVAVLSKE